VAEGGGPGEKALLAHFPILDLELEVVRTADTKYPKHSINEWLQR
jgi:hypothetical protein